MNHHGFVGPFDDLSWLSAQKQSWWSDYGEVSHFDENPWLLELSIVLWQMLFLKVENGREQETEKRQKIKTASEVRGVGCRSFERPVNITTLYTLSIVSLECIKVWNNMYIYIYTYTYIYIYTYTYIYIYIYVYMYICIYIYMYICIYVCMYICIYVYMYICIYVYMYIYICIYTYIYIYMRNYIELFQWNGIPYSLYMQFYLCRWDNVPYSLLDWTTKIDKTKDCTLHSLYIEENRYRQTRIYGRYDQLDVPGCAEHSISGNTTTTERQCYV